MSTDWVDVLAKHRILFRISRVLERTREARAFCSADVHRELNSIESALDALEAENAQQIDTLMAHQYAMHNYPRSRVS